MRASVVLLCTAVSVTLSMSAPVAAQAQDYQPDVVSEDPANYTPELVSTSAVGKPRVDSIAQLGSQIWAGGLFDRVTDSRAITTYARDNFMVFDASTGELSPISPSFNDQVWAIEAFGNSVYVGGEFSRVDGISRPKLVKLNAADGTVDTAFNAQLRGGRVTELKMVAGRLIVGASTGKKLMALNPISGDDTGYIDLGISDPIPNAWGSEAVYRFSVNPAGTKLVATGNFQTVAGESRTRLFVADLGLTRATLDSWYYPGFEKRCASTHPRRIAYLQGVDFSPDGSYFAVAATGQIPAVRADVWPKGNATYHTVCDAVGRFDMSNDQRPHWVNYTGGDSVWDVAATGSAVYAQGHFQWLDNPDGFASQDGGGAVERKGIGAIHPDTGMALPWNPSKPAAIGGKDMLATSTGLWIGSDSRRIGGEYHRGLAFMPLP